MSLFPWTAGRVRQVCGLLPRRDYLAEMFAETLALPDEDLALVRGRPLGLTTEMLLIATAAAMDRRDIVLLLPNQAAADAVRKRWNPMLQVCGHERERGMSALTRVMGEQRFKQQRGLDWCVAHGAMLLSDHSCRFDMRLPGRSRL